MWKRWCSQVQGKKIFFTEQHHGNTSCCLFLHILQPCLAKACPAIDLAFLSFLALVLYYQRSKEGVQFRLLAALLQHPSLTWYVNWFVDCFVSLTRELLCLLDLFFFLVGMFYFCETLFRHLDVTVFHLNPPFPSDGMSLHGDDIIFHGPQWWGGGGRGRNPITQKGRILEYQTFQFRSKPDWSDSNFSVFHWKNHYVGCVTHHFLQHAILNFSWAWRGYTVPNCS